MTTATKERPIALKAPKVRAILNGATQLRVVCKPQSLFDGKDEIVGRFPRQDGCPLGKPGDWLWVKEAWRFYGRYRNDWPEGGFEYRADLTSRTFDQFENWREVMQAFDLDAILGRWNKWREATTLPRWASRLTLEITGVRVERLQDISEADAIAEGCDGNCGVGSIPAYVAGPCSYHYAQLWDQINGKGSWAANPFVWAVEFRRVES